MPRKKNDIDKIQKEQLSKYVYDKFGKKLKYSHQCIQLSAEIKSITGKNIGANTVRRFLGFLNHNFSTSLTTLNILSEYAGFHDWYSFTEKDTSTSFMPLTLDQEALLYLNFYAIDVKTEGDMNYHNVCRNIAVRILYNPVLLEKLAPLLAKIPTAQIYFFERFPYIDGLCNSYKRSIQLYLQKKTDEAQIFGNCLLFLSAYLCNNHEDLKTYHVRLNQHPLNDSMHPFAIARYIGSNLLYAHIKRENTVGWVAEVNKWNNFFLRKENMSFWQYPYFQHMICDYLNLAGYFNDSYQIVKTKDHLVKKYEIEKGYEEALDVITHISRYAKSPDKFMNWLAATDSPNNISPLFKKYFELQVLCVHRSLLPKGKKLKNVNIKIEELVTQTGFTYFHLHLL